MFLACLKESRRTWFKRTLEYREGPKVASIRPGDGWDWIKGYEGQIDRVKTEAKRISRKLRFTVDSEYAAKVKTEKKAWFLANKQKT